MVASLKFAGPWSDGAGKGVGRDIRTRSRSWYTSAVAGFGPIRRQEFDVNEGVDGAELGLKSAGPAPTATQAALHGIGDDEGDVLVCRWLTRLVTTRRLGSFVVRHANVERVQ